MFGSPSATEADLKKKNIAKSLKFQILDNCIAKSFTVHTNLWLYSRGVYGKH